MKIQHSMQADKDETISKIAEREIMNGSMEWRIGWGKNILMLKYFHNGKVGYLQIMVHRNNKNMNNKVVIWQFRIQWTYLFVITAFSVMAWQGQTFQMPLSTQNMVWGKLFQLSIAYTEHFGSALLPNECDYHT